MPNWCYQNLVVTGNKVETRKFLKAIYKPEDYDELGRTINAHYDMNQLVPIPDESEWTDSLDSFFGGALGVWGSKWGACDIEIDDKDSYPLHLRYMSAWSPCDKLIENISKQFPKLVFGYSCTEEADFFAGWELYCDGEKIAEDMCDMTQPPELIQMYEKADEANDEALMDDFYEAQSEWRNAVTDQHDIDLDATIREYVAWRRGSKRRKVFQSFIPSF
jgi:hypothetical protein